MPDLFLEIGTEEIPAGYIQPALEFMGRELAVFFEKSRIQAGKPRLMGTPRRLVVFVPGVEDRQPDIEETHLGPNVKVAFDPEGKPTKAAIGFARGKGIDVADLTREPTSKGEVVCARVEKKGEPTDILLTRFFTEWIGRIPFPKKMRWSSRKLPFARPVHWIAALFGDQTLEFEFEGIASSNVSRGHRFLNPGSFQFSNLDEYLKQCESHFLVVDPDTRRQRISKEVNALAQEVKGAVKDDPDLLDTVNFLVEYPVAIRGEFDKTYLELPKELLVITMKYHQKYFPVWSGDKLLPYFITISNMTTDGGEEIQRGNQRVLKARLEDARFFYDEDRKRQLEDFVDELKGVVFQKNLGTVLEKVERIEALLQKLPDVASRPNDVNTAIRAARLCKADLVTQMVFEFPELQGIMGGYYAESSGEPPEVALAIKEHYQPAFAGDAVPSTLPGALVALADKLDTIVGCIGVKLIPSGSEDPYALRRHALGIIQILIEKDMAIDLEALIDMGIETLGDRAKLSADDIRGHCRDLFAQRLKTLLNGEGYEYDVIEAVLATKIDSFKNVREKAKALSELKQQDYFEPLAVAFRRVVSIIEGDVVGKVDPKLLQESGEKALYEKFQEIEKPVRVHLEARDYSKALAKIVEIKPAVDAFFDQVMVNVKDPALKANRMTLLAGIASLFSQIADFSKIVVKKG